MNTRVSKGVFLQYHHQARDEYSSNWGIYSEGSFMITKSEICHEIHIAGLDQVRERKAIKTGPPGDL